MGGPASAFKMPSMKRRMSLEEKQAKKAKQEEKQGKMSHEEEYRLVN